MLESCNSIFDDGLTNINTTIYVTKAGNDISGNGSFQFPYLTIQKGLNEAYNLYALPNEPQNNPSTYIRPAVSVGAGVYNDGNIVFHPQVQLWGAGKDYCEIVGDISIDSKWSNYVPINILNQSNLRSTIINFQVTGNTDIDFDLYESNQGRITAYDCRFTGTFTMSQKVTGVVGNSYKSVRCEYGGDVTFNGIPALFKDTTMISWMGALLGSVTLNQVLGSAADNYFETCGGTLQDVIVNGNSSQAPPYYLVFDHQLFPNAILTIDGKYAQIKSSVYSIPETVNINLLNDAVLSQIFKFLPFPDTSSVNLIKSELLWTSDVTVIKNVAGGGYTTIYSHAFPVDSDVIDGKRRRLRYIANYSKTAGNSTTQHSIIVGGITLNFPSQAMGNAAIVNDTYFIEIYVNFRTANQAHVMASLTRHDGDGTFNDICTVKTVALGTWNKTISNNIVLRWQTISGTPTHTFTVQQLSSELL